MSDLANLFLQNPWLALITLPLSAWLLSLPGPYIEPNINAEVETENIPIVFALAICVVLGFIGIVTSTWILLNWLLSQN